jgi:large repetitive protein
VLKLLWMDVPRWLSVVIVGGSSGVKDLNGNALGANKSWTFTTVTPPQTTIGSGPEGTIASDTASFTFVSSKPGSSFQCSLDGSTFAACASPKDYPGPLSQGDHTFRVRAIDATGTKDPTPASRSWTVDTIAPTVDSVSPTDAATGVSPTSNVTATFSEAMDLSTISGQTFTLSMSGSPVSAQVTYDQNSRTATLDPAENLQAGATYEARIANSVEDLAGNAMAQEATWSFRVEAASPVTITPNPLNLSPTDVLFCSPRHELLTVTNNGPGNVTFAAVSITGKDATHFSLAYCLDETCSSRYVSRAS